MKLIFARTAVGARERVVSLEKLHSRGAGLAPLAPVNGDVKSMPRLAQRRGRDGR